jgi:acyl carrier protein
MSAPEEFDAVFFGVLNDVLGWQVEMGDGDGPDTIEGWDSLVQIRLVHALESRFEVRLPDAALLEEQNVASLKMLVHDAAQL